MMKLHWMVGAGVMGLMLGCGGEDDGSPPDPGNQLRRALGLGAPGGQGDGLGAPGGTGDGLGRQGGTGDGLGRSGSTGDGLGRPGGRGDGIGDGPGARGSSTVATPATACAAACDAGLRCRLLRRGDYDRCIGACLESLGGLNNVADRLQSCAGQACSTFEDCVDQVIRAGRASPGEQPTPIETDSLED